MKIVSDVLHLSYLDKLCLRVTVEAGQALAVLYREARLYKHSKKFLHGKFFICTLHRGHLQVSVVILLICIL